MHDLTPHLTIPPISARPAPLRRASWSLWIAGGHAMSVPVVMAVTAAAESAGNQVLQARPCLRAAWRQAQALNTATLARPALTGTAGSAGQQPLPAPRTYGVRRQVQDGDRGAGHA